MKKTYANNIVLKENFHPGEFIKDELEARELKQQEFAHEMGIARNVLNEIIQGKRNLTPAFALKLESVLGIKAEFWMKLQVNYDINLIRNQYSILIDKTKISNNKKAKLNKAILARDSKKASAVKLKKNNW